MVVKLLTYPMGTTAPVMAIEGGMEGGDVAAVSASWYMRREHVGHGWAPGGRCAATRW